MSNSIAKMFKLMLLDFSNEKRKISNNDQVIHVEGKYEKHKIYAATPSRMLLSIQKNMVKHNNNNTNK